MNERQLQARRTHQDIPAQLQHHVFRDRPTHPSRPVATRERYRATQYEHPMYASVEDEGYRRSVMLDDFGKRSEIAFNYWANPSVDQYLLQQPYNDRQYQASQGQARLSLAPASSRLYGDHSRDRPESWAQGVYEESHEEKGTSGSARIQLALTCTRSAILCRRYSTDFVECVISAFCMRC